MPGELANSRLNDVLMLGRYVHPGPVGELYVSEPCARRVAAEQGIDPRRELALYVVHGALHLCGYDDHEDADRLRMRAAEREVLSRLGYTSDGAPFE